MVLLALRKIPTDDPARRDACFRRGLDNGCLPSSAGTAAGHHSTKTAPREYSRKFLSPITMRCSIRSAPISPRRILELLGYENFTWMIPSAKSVSVHPRTSGGTTASWYGTMGSQLYLRHVAGPARCARSACNMDATLAAEGSVTGWKRSRTKTAVGRTLQYLRRSRLQGPGAEHRLTNGWAVMGLCAFDDPHRPSVVRGIRLPDQPNPDGTWTELETTGTGFPKVFISNTICIEIVGHCSPWPPTKNVCRPPCEMAT